MKIITKSRCGGIASSRPGYLLPLIDERHFNEPPTVMGCGGLTTSRRSSLNNKIRRPDGCHDIRHFMSVRLSLSVRSLEIHLRLFVLLVKLILVLCFMRFVYSQNLKLVACDAGYFSTHTRSSMYMYNRPRRNDTCLTAVWVHGVLLHSCMQHESHTHIV